MRKRERRKINNNNNQRNGGGGQGECDVTERKETFQGRKKWGTVVRYC